LGIFPPLLGVGEVPATFLESTSRGEPLRQQILEVLDVDRQKVDALRGRLDDLVERSFELGKILTF
jgi:hypothetical protein